MSIIMTRLFIIAVGLLIATPMASAENLFDWLKSPTFEKKSIVAKPADDARLLTLEPKESEMYPRVSAGAHTILVNVSHGKKSWISRRSMSNGDPLNMVSEDVHALDSIRWHGEKVSFLSQRGNGLGLWEKPVDGGGLMKRLYELNGHLTQPVMLHDGGLIAVRLTVLRNMKKASRGTRNEFNNWQVSGYRGEIIRIEKDGSEKVLNEGMNPALSPDGKWIVFSMPDGRDMHLYLMRVDGSELTQLPSSRSVDVQPAWSPDGKWIVFTSNRAKVDLRHTSHSDWDIWAIDREGRNLTQLTKDTGRDGAPSVSADGRVYFHSDRKVSSDLKKEHQLKGSIGAFHVWSIALPK